MSGSFTADGVASSFEATVPWEIRQGDEVVKKGFTTAEGWMDKLYPWEAEVDVSGLAPGEYTFVALTDDPSGGEGFGPSEDSKTITVRVISGLVKFTRARLNRTLLLRQHLLERVSMPVAEMSRHLIGLQAQENLPPYLSLAARLTDFDPYDVTRGLEDKSLVRLLTMRGTVHLLVPEDALMLRPFTASVHEREIKISQNIAEAREVDREAFAAAVAELLADAPMPQRDLGAALAERFPAYPATKLGQLARSVAPLAQIPPRGTWKGSGGVVYQHVDRWVGRPTASSPTSRRSCAATCAPSARRPPPT